MLVEFFVLPTFVHDWASVASHTSTFCSLFNNFNLHPLNRSVYKHPFKG
jgi:hypothetical protein